MKITVYTQPDCPPCQVVKQFLTHHGFAYELIDITDNLEARDYLVYELESLSTPTVTVDEHVVKGFDLPALEQLLHIKE